MASTSNLSMRLFGVPYQFPEAVDPRLAEVSSHVGRRFAENILMEAPVCTIIPGEPAYLPGKSDGFKTSTAMALLDASAGNFETLLAHKNSIKEEHLRLYDFKNNYTDYMKYVNILCRAGAIFLDLEHTLTCGNYTESFKRFDWRQYKWSSLSSASLDKIMTSAGSAASTAFKLETDGGNEGELNDILTNYNFVQFYIDPDTSPSENLSNTTGQSMLRGLTDNGSNTMKDIAFMANSGGIDADTLATFVGSSSAAMQEGINSILGGQNGNVVSSALSRIINLGSNVLQGHNIIIPDIYQSTDYKKSYSITVHLKSPYGTKLGYYLDIFVPMMHLLALAMPKQESANTFSSPFLVKAYVDGVFTCNLGLVDSISISKSTESWSVSGLPSEVDVTLNITDLYSDLMMSPSSEPLSFMNNSSLIEYLATNCGLSLVTPNLSKKVEFMYNAASGSILDIPGNVYSAVKEKVNKVVSDLLGLY